MKVSDLQIYKLVVCCTPKFELLENKLFALDMQTHARKIFKEDKYF